MSTSVATTAAQSPAVPGGPAVEPSSSAPPRKTRRSTPSALRLLLALSVLASLAFGVAGFQTGAAQSAATAAAGAESSQLLGIQYARNYLVQADAIAANAFLVGGLEPPDQRAAYDQAIADASLTVTNLAADDRLDSSGFASVSADIATYTGLIEQARANNRQGFPVGSAYLSQASALLNDSTLPKLAALVTASADDVAGSFTATTASLAFLLFSLAGLLAVAGVHVWITRRTHRYVNWPLLSAVAAMLVFGVIGGVVFVSTTSSAVEARNDSYARSLAVSQAYTSATEAKSLESFTLIKRGSGAALEAEVQTAIADARARLTAGTAGYSIPARLSDDLEAWVSQHDAIRKLDDGGDWDGAVAQAISTQPGSANEAFGAFSDAAQHDITENTRATRSTLDQGGLWSRIAGWALLVAGLGAAALSWQGVSLRLKEYR